MRMNIDEKWKTDPRRTKLVNLLRLKSDRPDRMADGMLVEVTWVLFSHKGGGIPLKEFKFIDNHQDWLDCELGEVVGGMVLIAGSDRYEEFFDKQAQNGSKGGRPRKNPTKPNETQNNPNEANHKPEKPSVSNSSSGSISNSQSAEERASAAAAAHSLSQEVGPILDLRGNSRIEEVLSEVPQSVQDDWVSRFETKSVKDTLLNGINHYMNENHARGVSDVHDWNTLLVAWVKREKKTLVKRRATSPIAKLPAAEVAVPETSPAEALSAASKFKMGSAVTAVLERQAGSAS